MRGRGALVLTSVALLLAASPATATMIEVETDADDFGTGASGGTCTLREAVEAARTNQAFGGCPKGGKKDTVKLIGNTTCSSTAIPPPTPTATSTTTAAEAATRSAWGRATT